MRNSPRGSLSKAVAHQRGREPRGPLHTSTSPCRGQPTTRRRRVISRWWGAAEAAGHGASWAALGGSGRAGGARRASPSLAGMGPCARKGRGRSLLALCQLSGSSFRLLAGLELPSLTCGLETFPVKEDAGKSQGILVLNVKSIEMLKKPWLLLSCSGQASCREPAGEPGLFQRAEKTRACPVL